MAISGIKANAVNVSIQWKIKEPKDAWKIFLKSKATGVDGVTGELLKYGPDLQKNKDVKITSVPDWKNVSLYKCIAEGRNFKGNCSLSVSGKAFGRILTEKQ